MEIKKAVIPAAGRGTRLERLTLVTAKELIPLVDRPALDWIMREVTLAGIDEVCIVTSVNKLPSLFAHTENLQIPVTYLIQERPRGLGDAVQVARNWCGDDPFALILPDDLILGDPILKRLIDHSSVTGNSSVALTEIPRDKIFIYGVADAASVSGDGQVQIRDLVEKPPTGTEPSNLSITGRYILTAEIWPELEKVRPSVDGEIQLTDALRALAKHGHLDGLVTGGMRHDLGSAESWLKANIAFGADRYGLKWLDEVVATIKG